MQVWTMAADASPLILSAHRPLTCCPAATPAGLHRPCGGGGCGLGRPRGVRGVQGGGGVSMGPACHIFFCLTNDLPFFAGLPAPLLPPVSTPLPAPWATCDPLAAAAAQPSPAHSLLVGAGRAGAARHARRGRHHSRSRPRPGACGQQHAGAQGASRGAEGCTRRLGAAAGTRPAHGRDCHKALRRLRRDAPHRQTPVPLQVLRGGRGLTAQQQHGHELRRMRDHMPARHGPAASAHPAVRDEVGDVRGGPHHALLVPPAAAAAHLHLLYALQRVHQDAGAVRGSALHAVGTWQWWGGDGAASAAAASGAGCRVLAATAVPSALRQRQLTVSSTPCGRGQSPVKSPGSGTTCESPSCVNTLRAPACSRQRMASGPVFWKQHHAARSTGAAALSCLRSTPPAVQAALRSRSKVGQ